MDKEALVHSKYSTKVSYFDSFVPGMTQDKHLKSWHAVRPLLALVVCVILWESERRCGGVEQILPSKSSEVAKQAFKTKSGQGTFRDHGIFS